MKTSRPVLVQPVSTVVTKAISYFRWSAIALVMTQPGFFQVKADTYHVVAPYANVTMKIPQQRVFFNIGSAVASAQAGDSIIIHQGMYRESIDVNQSGTAHKPIVIVGAPGEQIFITGADTVPVASWQPTGRSSVWQLKPWTYHGIPWSRFMARPDDERHRLIGRTEQVIVDGKLLRQVADVDSLAPGTFCADPLKDHALYVCFPHGGPIESGRTEVSLRPVLLHITGSHLIVRNLSFHYACNSAQQAAVFVEGSNNLVQDCLVQWTNGSGARLAGAHNTFRHLRSQFNGQLGMSGTGVGNLIEDCVFENNNVKGFDKNWEAGGIKIVLSDSFQIRRCVAGSNDGPGFWFDIDNRNGIIEECLSADNLGPGIIIEISQDITVKNNLCCRNGLKTEPGAWSYAGILLAESKDCHVGRNSCIGNRCGIAIRQSEIRTLQKNETLEKVAPKVLYNEGHWIQKNISAFNIDWQFAFFADNPVFGPHPSVAEPRLSEQEMHLLDPGEHMWNADSNVYYNALSQGLSCWGAPWRPKAIRYNDLAVFQRDHAIERGSIVADPMFVDWNRGNFQLLQRSPAKGMGAGVEAEALKIIESLVCSYKGG
jgi:hypothetical protein